MNNHKQVNYEKLEFKQWRENSNKVLNQLKTNDVNLLKKILNYAQHFGCSQKEIFEKIKEDKMFRNFFSIDPKRQRIHEKTAEEYLRNLKLVSNFLLLSRNNHLSEYITVKGTVLDGQSHNGNNNKSNDKKQLDFAWETASFKCYASHKYTKESGGYQNGQYYNELMSFFKHFHGTMQKDTVFFAICDGGFYDKEKIEALRILIKDEHIFVCSIEEVAKILKKLKNSTS